MNTYAVDLHLHTAFSPCADPAMTPHAVALRAKQLGLAIIALCDHDTVGGTLSLRRDQGIDDLVVLDGVEITTIDQVHVIGIFPNWPSIREMARVLGLAVRETAEEVQGIGETAALPTISQAVQAIHGCGGLAIAAHVDRPSSGLIGRLGTVPADVPFDALEVSESGLRQLGSLCLEQYGLPVLVGSDSHALSEIGRVFSRLTMRAPCFEELQLTLREQDGRRWGCA